MGFQPVRQQLILGELTVIFGCPQDMVGSTLFLGENQPAKEKREHK